MSNTVSNVDLLLLYDVCKKYFGVSTEVARRKAAAGTLPIPAFRLSGTQRGPLWVRKSDLDALIHTRVNSAKKSGANHDAAHS